MVYTSAFSRPKTNRIVEYPVKISRECIQPLKVMGPQSYTIGEAFCHTGPEMSCHIRYSPILFNNIIP